MNATILATSVAVSGTLEGAFPLVLSIEMSGADWTPTVIGAAVATVIGAATLGTVAVIKALSDMNRKADVIVETTTKTHTAANSTLAAANASLDLLRMEYKGMQESKDKEIEGYKREIAVMNAARVAAVAATVPATVPPTVAPTESELAAVKVTVEDTNKVVNEELKKP